ncbi:hypothetical protein NAH07_11990, partial [Francisella tularensis subsp. holarctica]|nr:hypothetical protein [Francisella tularensis subsp. holarctica]
DNQNISYNKLSKIQIRKYFKRDSLEDIEGVLITTIGKLYDGKNLNQAYDSFNNQVDKRKNIIDEHEIDSYIDNKEKP